MCVRVYVCVYMYVCILPRGVNAPLKHHCIHTHTHMQYILAHKHTRTHACTHTRTWHCASSTPSSAVRLSSIAYILHTHTCVRVCTHSPCIHINTKHHQRLQLAVSPLCRLHTIHTHAYVYAHAALVYTHKNEPGTAHHRRLHLLRLTSTAYNNTHTCMQTQPLYTPMFENEPGTAHHQRQHPRMHLPSAAYSP